ncbi:MAG: hypothetical protein ABL921_15290 [Pirellula sp.]
MNANWNRSLLLLLTTGLLMAGRPSQLLAQPGAGYGGGGYGGGFGMEGMDGPDAEEYRAFREKFKGVVRVTHEIRVGGVKAQSISGLALLIKKSVSDDKMGGMAMGGMAMGGMGGSLRAEYGILAAKELIRPELRPEITKLVETLNPNEVNYRLIISDLPPTANMLLPSVVLDGKVDSVEKNGVGLMRLSILNGVVIETEPADLDITSPLVSKESVNYEWVGKSLVPIDIKDNKVGAIAVSSMGGAGIFVSRKGKIELVSGQELFTTYVELLQNQRRESDPFASGNQITLNENGNASDDPFRSDPAPSNPNHARRLPMKAGLGTQSTSEKSVTDDALVRALTSYKQSKDKASRETSSQLLRQVLGDQFDAQRSVRRAEIAELRTRLDQLEAEEMGKSKRRNEIIDERFKQLVQ